MAVPRFIPPVPRPLHPFSWERPLNVHEFRVTQRFNDTNPKYPEVKHLALDLGNGRLGDEIYAPAHGVIVGEGFLTEPWSQSTDLFGTGNFGGIGAVIDHGDGWFSGLWHLHDTVINKGQHVKKGQLIGHLGDTGSAKGQGHVHWDLYHGRPIRVRENLVNAWPLLEQNNDKLEHELKKALENAKDGKYADALANIRKAQNRATHIVRVIT